MLDDERRADLEEAVTEGRMLAEMTATDGWQKVMVTGFENLREGYKADLLNAKDLPAMFKAQAGIKIINVLLDDPKRRIQEGREAAEILAKEKIVDEIVEDKE